MKWHKWAYVSEETLEPSHIKVPRHRYVAINTDDLCTAATALEEVFGRPAGDKLTSVGYIDEVEVLTDRYNWIKLGKDGGIQEVSLAVDYHKNQIK